IGDIIESVRRFDAATQRSLTALGAITLTPQRELVPLDDHDDRTSTFIDYARRAGAAVLVYELDDVTSRGLGLEEQWRASATDAAARIGTAPPYEHFALPW